MDSIEWGLTRSLFRESTLAMPMLLKWTTKNDKIPFWFVFDFFILRFFDFFSLDEEFFEPMLLKKIGQSKAFNNQKAYFQEYDFLWLSAICIAPNYDDINKPPTTKKNCATKTTSISCFWPRVVITAINDKHQPSRKLHSYLSKTNFTRSISERNLWAKSVTSPSLIEPKFFGSKPFRLKKFKNLPPLCFNETEWNLDCFDEIVKVSKRELLVHFLTEIEFIKISEKSSGWKIFDRLALECYEFIDIELIQC